MPVTVQNSLSDSWFAWFWHQRRFWLLAPLLVAFPLFFIGGPQWQAPPLYRELWSQGHMVFFALLSVWLTSVVPMHRPRRSEEHTSELQSRGHLVCRLLLEKKKSQH